MSDPRQHHLLTEGNAFDGPDYEPDRDYVRLTGQILAVFELMQDGEWRTLPEISRIVEGSQCSISAQLRQLRKAKYGAHIVEKVYVGEGLYEYRLIVNSRP